MSEPEQSFLALLIRCRCRLGADTTVLSRLNVIRSKSHTAYLHCAKSSRSSNRHSISGSDFIGDNHDEQKSRSLQARSSSVAICSCNPETVKSLGPGTIGRAAAEAACSMHRLRAECVFVGPRTIGPFIPFINLIFELGKDRCGDTNCYPTHPYLPNTMYRQCES